MCTRYYDKKKEAGAEFTIGEFNLKVLSKKEKMPGLFIRKLQVNFAG